MFDKNQVIPIGSDHGGYEMKSFLVNELTKRGYRFSDVGTHSAESVDYPDFIHLVARSVNNGEYPYGIVLCGSGQGASMTANKYLNVRAGLCWNMEQTKLCRQHNNANIISLPGRFLDFHQAAEMIMVFLDTEFEGGRHIQRINKIAAIHE